MLFLVFVIVYMCGKVFIFFFSSRSRHTRWNCDWSSDVCSSDLGTPERNPAAEDAGLKQHPRKYFEMLYADTALNGDVPATRCGHAFFGTSRSLFATDAPFCSEQGRGLIANTIAAVKALEIPDAERER